MLHVICTMCPFVLVLCGTLPLWKVAVASDVGDVSKNLLSTKYLLKQSLQALGVFC